jgi:hypothetical protein
MRRIQRGAPRPPKPHNQRQDTPHKEQDGGERGARGGRVSPWCRVELSVGLSASSGDERRGAQVGGTGEGEVGE